MPDNVEFNSYDRRFKLRGFLSRPAFNKGDNEVTLYSLSYALEYDVRQYAKRISPTPLLMMVAAADHTMPAVLGFEFYHDALQPKKLVVLPRGHYDAYMPDGSLDLVIQSSAECLRLISDPGASARRRHSRMRLASALPLSSAKHVQCVGVAA